MSGEPGPKSEDALNHRQRIFVAGVARGLSPQQAAREAAFSHAYAKKAGRLLKQPMIARAVAEIREQARTLAAYDVKCAMDEAKADHAFAVSKGNAMAAVKATELRAKLSGLLVEKVEIVSVNLVRALEQAQARVNGLVDVTPPGAASWPRIAGDSIPDDPKSGHVEDESAHRVHKSWS